MATMTEVGQELKLYGEDLFGETIRPDSRGIIADKFVVPPFSVLNACEGFWQERKRAWLRMGIKSEIGREKSLTHSTESWFEKHGKTGGGKDVSNTSLFDPVLCELAYRWFCPKGGLVLDPFAGGSVRGIVAAMLGRKYWGCDLSRGQIKANEIQADSILGESYKIKISGAMMHQKFHPCTLDYINDVCQGRCCQGTNGIKVTVHQSEVQRYGDNHRDGFMVPDERGLCPYKTDNGLCSIHNDKPFGCKASPFTLNKNDTLIIRNRYRLLRCYNTENAIPAYLAHSWSLKQIFGEKEGNNIIEHFNKSSEDYTAEIPAHQYSMLKDNDYAKGSTVESSNRPTWTAGDALDLLDNAPLADFIFSCPPYGDLEKYSDDPCDLSTMEYHTFIATLKQIILRCHERLSNNRFACFVVGEYRDKKGNYHNFVGDTVAAFKAAGFSYYNEIILVTSRGSLPIRIERQFKASRKIGKTHQNILIFVKGDGKKAARVIEQNGD